MKNKKTKIMVGVSLSVLGVLSVAAFASPKMSNLVAEDATVWNHYTEVKPTLDSNGIKEYWVNCTTHEHVFAKPSVDESQIVEKGAPALTFINSLEENDDRLLARHKKLLDFEDGQNKYISNFDIFEELEVVDGEGIGGSKALKISTTRKGDGHITIAKEYLDLVFADPAVRSLEFYAKGSIVTNNFRHQAIDQSNYTHDAGSVYSTFEINSDTWGLETNYKKFYLERRVYKNMNFSSWTIQCNMPEGGGSLYLDNIRMSYDDYDHVSVYGFENGRDYTQDTANKGFRMPNVQSGQCWAFRYDGGGGTGVAIDRTYVTEGVRSVKLTKGNGYVALYVNPIFYNEMPASGFTFDIYNAASNVFQYSNFVDNTNTNIGKCYMGYWQTFHLTKAQIGTDGRFLILNGSPAGDIYFDNFRYATAAQSFEDVKTTKVGEYAYVTDFTSPTTDTEGSAIRDKHFNYIMIFAWNKVSSISTVEGKSSHGAKSLKVVFGGLIGPVLLDPQLVSAMDEDSTVTFDIYSDDIANQKGALADVVRGQWCKVTLTKADLTNNQINGGTEYYSNLASKCTIYIDNLLWNY